MSLKAKLSIHDEWKSIYLSLLSKCIDNWSLCKFSPLFDMWREGMARAHPGMKTPPSHSRKLQVIGRWGIQGYKKATWSKTRVV